MSLPVVAFDLAETRHTVQDGALYARPNDIQDFARQVERLLTDQNLRHTIGMRGRELVIERLNWNNDKQNLLRAYALLFPTQSAAPKSPGRVDSITMSN